MIIEIYKPLISIEHIKEYTKVCEKRKLSIQQPVHDGTISKLKSYMDKVVMFTHFPNSILIQVIFNKASCKSKSSDIIHKSH